MDVPNVVKKNKRNCTTFYIPPPARTAEYISKQSKQDTKPVVEKSEKKKRTSKRKPEQNDRKQKDITPSLKDKDNDNSDSDVEVLNKNTPSDKNGCSKGSSDSSTNSEGDTSPSCAKCKENQLKKVSTNAVSKSKSVKTQTGALLDHTNNMLSEPFTNKCSLSERLKEILELDNNFNQRLEHDRTLSKISNQNMCRQSDEKADDSINGQVNNLRCPDKENQVFKEVWENLSSENVDNPEVTPRKRTSSVYKKITEGCIIEIFGFPTEFKTRDLLDIFSLYVNRGFQLRWVDDNHALGIFPSEIIAYEVLHTDLPYVETRPLTEAIAPSKEKAKKLMPPPPPQRPKTCSASARRLVSGALGIRAVFTKAEIEAEKEILKVAREEKILAAKNRAS